MEDVADALKDLSDAELLHVVDYLRVAAERSKLDGWFYFSYFRHQRALALIELQDRLDGLGKMPAEDILRLVSLLQLHRDDRSKSASLRRFWAFAMLDADDEKKARWANRERGPDADMDAALDQHHRVDDLDRADDDEKRQALA